MKNNKTDKQKINYLIFNKESEYKREVILFLHGFKMDMTTFDNIYPYLKEYMIITLDLPGFGESNITKPMSVKDYAICVNNLISQIVRKKDLIIIAHSFGGRIAIEYASLFKVSKIILVNGKVLRNNSINFRLKTFLYKLNKPLLKIFNKQKLEKIKKQRSSRDYKDLNEIMKKTFVKVVNYNPYRKLKKITTKVYINSSINDKEVLQSENETLYKLLKNSILVNFYHSTHFIYIEEEKRFIECLLKELNDDYSI